MGIRGYNCRGQKYTWRSTGKTWSKPGERGLDFKTQTGEAREELGVGVQETPRLGAPARGGGQRAVSAPKFHNCLRRIPNRIRVAKRPLIKNRGDPRQRENIDGATTGRKCQHKGSQCHWSRHPRMTNLGYGGQQTKKVGRATKGTRGGASGKAGPGGKKKVPCPLVDPGASREGPEGNRRTAMGYTPLKQVL